MADPPPILSYARPVPLDETTTPDGAWEVTVPVPPAGPAIIGFAVGLTATALVTIPIAVLLVMIGVFRPETTGLSRMILTLIALAIPILACGAVLRALLRRVRGGQAPVRFRVEPDGTLSIHNPRMWGETPRRWDAGEVDQVDVTACSSLAQGGCSFHLRIFSVILFEWTVIPLAAQDKELPKQLATALRRALNIEPKV